MTVRFLKPVRLLKPVRFLTPTLLFVASLTTPSTHAQVAAAATAGAMAAAPHLVAAAPAILTGAVSSSSAHVGQAVLAKLASPAALSNGLKLPAGSQLLGKVTQVQNLQSGGGTSKLGMLFDHVRTPDGQEQPIAGSLLRSVGSSAKRKETQPTDANQPSQSQQASGDSNPVGGLLGGVTNTVGGAVNGVVTTTGTLVGAVTGLPGVLLDSTGSLNAQGRNVDVPAGTRLSIEASAGAQ